MRTIWLRLDDDLDAALEAVCAEQGRDKAEVVTDVVRKYVDRERLQRTLQDPTIAELYQQLAAEDVALAEEGMAEYQQMLEKQTIHDAWRSVAGCPRSRTRLQASGHAPGADSPH